MVEALERRRAEDARNYENRTRTAHASQTFEVEGSGVVEIPKVAAFGLTYIERPFVSVGFIIDLDELALAYDLNDQAVPPVPIITGFVTDWDLNDRGWYVGAWCGVNIYWTTGPPPEPFPFQVDFNFRGIGIKDVDPAVRE